MSRVQRWDGAAREATDWNALRRDPELFFPQGKISVYLYSQGLSRRGPSFRIPYGPLVYSGSRFLVQESLLSTLTVFPYDDLESSPESDESCLYLPAPEHLSQEECLAYHITTRNFFAWLMGVPLVGSDPTSALLTLKERMDGWRDPDCDNLKSICDYICEQGYGEVDQFSAPPVPPKTSSPYTLYDPSLQHGDGNKALTQAAKLSSKAARARHRSSSTRLQTKFANAVQPEKKNHLSVHFSLPESDLVAISYQDTLPAAAPYLY